MIMVGSVEAGSEAFGVGFLGVGSVIQRRPVGISAKGVGLEDSNINFPLVVGLAFHDLKTSGGF